MPDKSIWQVGQRIRIELPEGDHSLWNNKQGYITKIEQEINFLRIYVEWEDFPDWQRKFDSTSAVGQYAKAIPICVCAECEGSVNSIDYLCPDCRYQE